MALQEAYTHDQELFRAREDPSILAPTTDAARFRADTVIGELLEPLEQRKVRGTVVRDRFVRKTGGRWAPDSKELTQLAAEEVRDSIDAVYKYAPEEKREEAIERRYGAAVNSANQALDAMQILHAGYEVNPTLGNFPKAKKIRTNQAVISEMAGFMSDLRRLDDLDWAENEEQVAALADYLKNTSDKVLEEVHRKVFDGRRAEYNFWAGQVTDADQHSEVKKLLKDPKKDLPKLKRTYSQEPVDAKELLERMEKLRQERLAAAKVRPEILFDMPEDAKEINDLIWGDDTSLDAVRMRNLEDGLGSSSYAARLRVVGVKGAGKAVPMVKESRRGKSTRRGLGPNQLVIADGPPAHVAKETREGFPPEAA